MNLQEAAEFYARITAPLLTAIRDAARALVPAYEAISLRLHETGQDREGRVVSTGSFIITRVGPNGSMWTTTIGFEGGQGFRDAIDVDVPKGKFPPMRLPIETSWLGDDRRGMRRNHNVPVPSLDLVQNSISWLGRRWPNVFEVDAEWIVKTLVERWLQHDSPEAAEEARQQVPGARWERIEPLRRWGQNEVWRVRDTQDLSTPHRALKMLRWKKGPGTTAYKRLQQEIEITRQLAQQHRGIVEVIDFGVPQDGDEWTPFYVMPLADTTLTKATDFGGNLEAVLNLGIKLANALGAAHERGVIHRDVKPDNILLFGPERQPVLADFGICFLVTDEGQRLTGSEANTVGPANYVAPELLGGKADTETIDPRVDVYSLGKTLYYALAGGEDLPREYQAQDRYDLRRKFDDPRMEHFYGLLERMVVEDPARRFPSMTDVSDALSRALENIKKSVPYVAGMYGGVATPLERFGQFARLLDSASGLQRRDGIRQAIVDARRVVDTLVAEFEPSSGRPAAREVKSRVAAEAAESLMAIGLPLVKAGDSEGFERWLDDAVGPLLPDGTGGMSDAANVRRAASVLAIHGVAVAAWQMERLTFLAPMLKKYDDNEKAFIHLSIFEREAVTTWQWVADSLKQSSVLARAEVVGPNLYESLVLVAALGAIASLLRTKPEVLAAAVPDSGDLEVVLFPAFMPQAFQWIEALPKLFIHSPALERDVAMEIFQTTPASLRDNCKRITPTLARILQWTARQLQRVSAWAAGFPLGSEWSKWCGGVGVRR